MPTVKEALKAKIDRARERKARAQGELDAAQVQIDTLKAELDALTPADDARLQRLQDLAVIKADA